ncbi:hypothetical protein [Dyella silvatica]|uniref:hypothetical protein n=1 Tax=Dyella silvatica TaxID=2992128 RepID=UPI0022516484|nr:hypothetical protein [Dyella silvatica]
MELWTFQRFQQPRLCVDAIEHDHDSATVKLRSGAKTYRLAFDQPAAAEQIAIELMSLTDSAAPLWSTLRESPPDSSWHALGTFLDTHSLIGEGHDQATAQLAAQTRRIRDCVEETARKVSAGISPERRSAMARHAAQLRQKLGRTSTTGHLFEPGGDPFDASVQPNFFLALLLVEFEYFRRSAPLTFAATDLLLEQLAAGMDAGQAPDIAAAITDSAGLYNEHDLFSHLWLVGSLLLSSTGDDARRYPSAALPAPFVTTGLEFMRQTEVLTRDTLDSWGENPYVTAINRLNGAYSPLVAGPFIEQYHVTSRFVEIITPLLSMRLAKPLRSMMFRYYSEEYGHEALESTTCEALGVAPAMLEKIVPLPLHFAFVDTLTLLADLDPISSFTAIMVIEGIFGEPPKMSLRLAAAARENAAFREVSGDHEELNETLNHNSISRDMFEHVTALGIERQAIAMRRILFLLELNQRAWGGIADFYGQQEQLWLHGPYGQRLAPDQASKTAQAASGKA